MKSPAEMLSVRPGEGRLVALMFAYAACTGLARLFVDTSSAALFLSRCGASWLPYTYIAVAVTCPLLSALYERLARNVTFTRLVTLNLASLLVVLLGLRLAANTDARWPSFLLMMFFEILHLFTNLAFWGVAGRVFNVRQSKRLFGLIESGEVAATILGGIAVDLVVEHIGAANLLFGAIGALVASLLLVWTIFRSSKEPVKEQESEDESGTDGHGSSIRELLHDSYALQLFALGCCFVFTYFCITQIFLDASSIRFHSQDQMAAFFGTVEAIVGVVGLLTSVVLTGPLLGRFGVSAGVVGYPAGILVVSVLLSVAGIIPGGLAAVFWLATLNRILDSGFLGCLYQPATVILLQPLSPDKRVQVQTVGEGIVEPIVGGLAGVLFLFIANVLHQGIATISIVLAVGALAWVVIGYRLTRSYAALLLSSLSRRLLHGEAIHFTDASSLTMVYSNLRHPHPGVAIYSLNLLQEINPALWETCLIRVLSEHPAPEVRLHVLERLEHFHMTGRLSHVRTVAGDSSNVRLQAAAVRVLAILGGEAVFDEVEGHLESTEPHLRLGAMVGMLRCGALEGVVTAGGRLIKLTNSPLASDRTFAAQVLGEVGIESFYRPLFKLLHDDDMMTRKAALTAAGRLKNPRLWPSVAENIKVPAVQASATTALAQGGITILPLLQSIVYDSAQPWELQSRLVRVASQLGDGKATEWLAERLDHPHPHVRHLVLVGLARRGYQALEAWRARIEQRVRRHAEMAAWILAVQRDVGTGHDVALLQAGLDYQLGVQQDDMVLWLSLVYDSKALQKVRESLGRASVEQRANALEVIDVMLSAEHKALLMPLCDDLTIPVRLQMLSSVLPDDSLHAQDVDQRLAEVLTGPADPFTSWLKSCALLALAHRCTPRDDAQANRVAWIRAATESADLLVGETARHSLSRLSLDGPRDLNPGGTQPVISTVEKVMILKVVSLFAQTPDEVLSRAAGALKVVDLAAGDTLFHKGEPGTSMYIIVGGKIRIHDNDITLAHLSENEIFGEMAVLDSEPRTADATATEETRLMQLDQDALYELMSDYQEVMQGVVRVLCRKLRDRGNQVLDVYAQFNPTAPV